MSKVTLSCIMKICISCMYIRYQIVMLVEVLFGPVISSPHNLSSPLQPQNPVFNPYVVSEPLLSLLKPQIIPD